MPGVARQIGGQVLSDNDSTQVIGALCEVTINGTSVTKTATDADGKFIINLEGKSEATLTLSAPGYGVTDVVIPSGGRDIKDMVIYLPDAIDLQAVTVEANAVTHRNGRSIVYPSAQDIKASHTAIDLFQILPLHGLTADPINRSLSVDGGTPMILINNTPSTMNDVNALSPGDIDRIEYSRTTPARYIDKGYSGLIKITLKHRDNGGNIRLWGRGCPTTAFVDGDLSTSYHQGPSQFKLYYYGSWRNYQQVYDFKEQSYIGDDFRVDLKTQDRNPFNYFAQQIILGYDYRPDSKTIFSAKAYGTIQPSHRRNIASNEDSYAGNYDDYYESHQKYYTPSLDLFFHRDFNDNNSLEIQMVGTLKIDKFNSEDKYFIDPANPVNYAYSVDGTRRSLITEASYNHTFSPKTFFSAGYQNTISHSRNKYPDADFRPVLTENNNYIYASLSQTFGKFNLSLSTGAKLFWMKNDDNKRHFIRNLSNAYLTWNINNNWNMQASFNYSPSIPRLSAITDYKQQTTPYLINNGNPDLKVADYFKYRLSASYSYKKFSVSVYGEYETANNPRTDATTYLGNKMFLRQTINYDVQDHIGGSLQARISGIAGFGANVRMDVDNYHTVGPTWDERLTSFYAYASLWWNKGPFTVRYWRKIPCKYLNGSYVNKEENGDGLSFVYTPNKHWTVSAEWWYMFENKGTKYPQWDLSSTAPSYTDRYIKNNANMVVLSVTYNADFGSIFNTGRRRLNNADNSSSIVTY